MADLVLTNQAREVEAIKPHVEKLKQLMGERREIWDSLRPVERWRWLQNSDDPVMAELWSMYVYLDETCGFERIKPHGALSKEKLQQIEAG